AKERAERAPKRDPKFRRQLQQTGEEPAAPPAPAAPVDDDGQYPLFDEAPASAAAIDEEVPEGFREEGQRIREEDIPAFLRADLAPGGGVVGKDQSSSHLEAVPRRQGPYEPPAADLLDAPGPVDVRRQERETKENIEILEDTLTSFKIGAKVVSIERGPAITRYEVEPEKGIRVARIAALADDLARVLEAVDVRIEAPVPGTSVVGIEVPNKTRGLVTLRDILTSDEMVSNPSLLAFALGKDIAGRVIVGDLTKMPHLLVAGATNSGKSVCLNTLILSIVFRASPDEVKFLMIDPKRVELSLYDDIPHLIAPVVHDAKEAAGLLRHAIVEMEERYRTLAGLGVRNIAEYMELAQERDDLEPMPYLVIVIDELADLMMQAAAEFEHSICRIAQLARAVGIHLVVATQRPSVNVVTGTIKANIPSRIAFAVSSQTDSRVILDQVGADRLIGQGDMLYSPIDASKPKRIQGAYVSAKEINRVVQYLQSWGEPDFELEPLPVDTMKEPVDLPTGIDDEGVDDDLFGEIVGFVTSQKRVSTSMLQRKFRIGYNRAARLIDILEEKGLVGPADGSKPRKVIAGLAGTPLDMGDLDDDDLDEAAG
ncbi:MAG: cell division protein FtsK, partial [Armatimonadia bacterium]|nr:cell division protein FtsK [Armatimonadia bacterium]